MSEEKKSICGHPTCAASFDGKPHAKEQCSCSIECCHTTSTDESWEKEFDEQFWEHRVPRFTKQAAGLKSFIHRTAQEEYERGRKDAVEFINSNCPKLVVKEYKDQLYIGIMGKLPSGESFQVLPDSVLEAALKAPKE